MLFRSHRGSAGPGGTAVFGVLRDTPRGAGSRLTAGGSLHDRAACLWGGVVVCAQRVGWSLQSAELGEANLEFADDNERRIYEEAIAFARANKKARCAQLTDPTVYPPEDHPVSVFMAGSPGAGKTEAARELIAQFERLPNAPKVLRIDPDDLRAEFDGYTGTNSWLFQGAASIWVDRMVDLVLAQGQSFILDGTLSDYDRAKRNIERSLKRRRAEIGRAHV